MTRDFSFETISGIQLAGIGVVQVRQDTVQSVRLVADDNIIDRVRLGTGNGVLTIGIEPGSYGHVTVQIFATLTSVNSLVISGAGTIATAEPIRATALSTLISGAGNVTLNGSASDHNVVISGAGAVHAFDLVASRCTALISGQGSAEVHATQSLDATISGVGNVIYDGNPAAVSQHVSGVGSVSRRP